MYKVLNCTSVLQLTFLIQEEEVWHMNMKKKICKVLVFMMVLGSIGSVNLSSVAYAEKGDLGEGYDLTLIDREYNSVEEEML